MARAEALGQKLKTLLENKNMWQPFGERQLDPHAKRNDFERTTDKSPIQRKMF